jgi:DNA-binding MarR family transcriptional regulator
MSLPIDERLGHHIKRVEQELIAAKNRVLAPFGLNVPQYTILLVLSNEPGLSGAALARRCLVTPQTMSTMLRTLESKGLTERRNHPVHTQVQETRLTRKGRSVLAKADVEAVKVEVQLNDLFTEAQRMQLRTMLAACGKALAGVAEGAKQVAKTAQSAV